jgi:hypothetical protein
MTRGKKWKWFWMAWLATFVILDIVAGSDSLSRTLGRMFPKNIRRILLVGLMALLTWHFWLQPQVGPMPVPLVELP